MSGEHESAPSGSREAIQLQANPTIGGTDDDADFKLQLKNEDAAIALLGLDTALPPLPATESKGTAAEAEDERLASIDFRCSACDMHELVHYYGKAPPFVYGVSFLEDTYVMRDPFQPPPPRWKPKAEYFVALGVNCNVCARCVCKDVACSFYYTATYCLQCAQRQLKQFPLEAQTKLRKQLSSK